MIGVQIVDTAQNIAHVTMDRVCPIREFQVDMVTGRILPTAITTTTAEIDIAEIDTVGPLRIGVEVKEMITTEITLVIENDVITITITTTEAVREVAAEAEIGGEKVDEIARKGRAGIDLEIGTKGVETGIDLGNDTGVDLGLDPEIGLVTDPEKGLVIEIVVDLAIDPEIEKGLVIEETDTTKTIDRVDDVAKVRTKGITIVGQTGGKQTAVSAQKF